MKTSLALGWSSRTPIVEKIFPKSTRKKTSIKLLFAAIFLSYQNDCLCKFVKGRSRNEEVVSCARFHRNNEFTRKRICQDSILMKNSFQEYRITHIPRQVLCTFLRIALNPRAASASCRCTKWLWRGPVRRPSSWTGSPPSGAWLSLESNLKFSLAKAQREVCCTWWRRNCTLTKL